MRPPEASDRAHKMITGIVVQSAEAAVAEARTEGLTYVDDDMLLKHLAAMPHAEEIH